MVPVVRTFVSYSAFRADQNQCFAMIRAAVWETVANAPLEFAQMRHLGRFTLLQRDKIEQAIAAALAFWTCDSSSRFEWSKFMAKQIVFGMNSFLVGLKTAQPYYTFMSLYRAVDIAEVFYEIIQKHIWYQGSLHEPGVLDDFARFHCFKCARECRYCEIDGLLVGARISEEEAAIEAKLTEVAVVVRRQEEDDECIFVLCETCSTRF